METILDEFLYFSGLFDEISFQTKFQDAYCFNPCEILSANSRCSKKRSKFSSDDSLSSKYWNKLSSDNSLCPNIRWEFLIFIFILDEHEGTQKKTFTKWINVQLAKVP